MPETAYAGGVSQRKRWSFVSGLPTERSKAQQAKSMRGGGKETNFCE
jgi:hypothetical protein